MAGDSSDAVSEEPTLVENADGGEVTIEAEGKMTDVPGDDAADMVPNCEDKEACKNMGVFAAMGGKGNVAVALFQKACDLGSGAGCSNLANLYLAGEVIPKDRAKAREYFNTACEKGDTDACGLRDELDAKAARDEKTSEK
jgi:TPR repeat protein